MRHRIRLTLRPLLRLEGPARSLLAAAAAAVWLPPGNCLRLAASDADFDPVHRTAAQGHPDPSCLSARIP